MPFTPQEFLREADAAQPDSAPGNRVTAADLLGVAPGLRTRRRELAAARQAGNIDCRFQ
jgi:hypothetical protein